MTATSTPTDSITILRSNTPLAKGVVIGEDGLSVVGKVKMGFLFDVTERTVAGLNDLHELLQGLQRDLAVKEWSGLHTSLKSTSMGKEDPGRGAGLT